MPFSIHYNPQQIPTKLQKMKFPTAAVLGVPQLLALLLSLLHLPLTTLCIMSVTPSPSTINSNSTYQWTVTSIPVPAPTNNTIVMQFPANVVLDSGAVSAVLTWNGTVYVAAPGKSGNSLIFGLMAGDAGNTSFVFRVTNVKNPSFRTIESVTFFRGGNSLGATINYDKGPITNCDLSFEGITGQQISRAFLTFQTTNPITRNQTLFRIYYGGVYALSGTKIVDNNNITCAVSINNSSFSVQVPAVASIPGQPPLDCNFSGVDLPANAAIRLRLTNVRNPPFKNNYLSSPLSVQSMDGVRFYDISSSCTASNVTLDSYEGSFTQSANLVNSLYPGPVIETSRNITRLFLTNDQIHIYHQSIEFPTINTYILFERPTSGNRIQFNLQNTSTGLIVTRNTNNNNNLENDRIRLILSGYVMKMPPSAAQVRITFRFLRQGLEYLEVYAIVGAISAIFDPTDLLVTPVSREIGQRTAYTFSINISQPLGSTPRILIDVPLQLTLAQLTPASTCLFASTLPIATATPTCSVFDPINKILQVDLILSSTLGAPQVIALTIGDLINPDDPTRIYSYGIETYYTSNNSNSKVQLGTSLATVTYTSRLMNIQVNSNSYTVNQFPSLLALTYIPGVRIPTNLLLIFNFTTDIADITYRNTTVNNSVVIYSRVQSGQQVQLMVSGEIAAGSIVVISFEFKAPSSVSIFDAVSAEVRAATGTVFERTGGSLSIAVTTPAMEVFTITPISAMTGITTNYTLSFFTNVYHPSNFFLSISFPTDIVINISAATCLPSTLCRNIIDRSQAGLQTIWLNITTNTNTYTITITSIRNPRRMGVTGQFVFETWTAVSGGSSIVSGVATAMITVPNAISAGFDLSKEYYRMNVEPVGVRAVFTNKLVAGDYVRVVFDYRTYGLASAGAAGVRCSNALCTVDSGLSTSFTTVIRVVPSSLTQPIVFSIEGLNSSATTFPSQEFQVIIRSFTSDDRQIDQGRLTYNLSCRSSSTLIAKNCQTCKQSQLTCTSCYSSFFLFSGNCVTSCASSSTFQAFPGDTVCISCIAPCATCISATQCLTCTSGFILYENSSCMAMCNGDGFYNATGSNGQKMCLRCWSPSCIRCTDGGSSSCTDCGSAFLQNGRCETTCDASTSYVRNQTGECLPCSTACNGCNGSLNSNCILCRAGYFNISGLCQANCPTQTVALMDNTCGCEGDCSRCELTSTRCLACQNNSLLLYNYQCLQTCPESSYSIGTTCRDCASGCLNCTATACLQCLPGYNIYENRCFTECNSAGERFAAVNGLCIECPVGCDLCDAGLNCSVCLANYTLVGVKCQLTCELNNNCVKPNPVPEKILPVPGFITAAVWLVVLTVMKFVFVTKLYFPYGYLFIGCVIEYVLVLISVAKMRDSIQLILSQLTKRLLLTTTAPQQYQYAVVGLLATSIALNYVSNLVFLFLYCKYLRKYIPQRQIDKISNYLVLALGLLSNYRFILVAYSKLFPKPSITVQNQSKLTPIHYMCISSLFTAILPLGAAGVLIYNQYPLTDLFMLGVDLLIIVVLEVIFTIWMVSVDKPDDYFEGTKKYTREDFNKTTEGLNQRQEEVNYSKAKLPLHIANDHSIMQVEQIDAIEEDQMGVSGSYKKFNHVKSDNQNEPLPVIPPRTSQLNVQTIKVRPKMDSNSQGCSDDNVGKDKEEKEDRGSLGEQRTLRNGKGKASPRKNKNSQEEGASNILNPRRRETSKNYSKQKKAVKNNKQNSQDMTIKINDFSHTQINKAKLQDLDEQYDNQINGNSEPTLKQANSDILKREKKVIKPDTQRTSAIFPATMMRKKQTYGVFQSDVASSQVDQIDFESLIQTRMIDKSNHKTKARSVTNDDAQPEEVSPSWFNQQNQRFDFSEESDV